MLEKIETLLSARLGETTPDGLLTIETVHCLGSCSMSPVMRIDDETYGRLKVDRLVRIFRKYRPEVEPGETAAEEQVQ